MSRLAPRRASLPVVIVVALLAVGLGIGGGWGLSSATGGNQGDVDSASESSAVVRAYLEALARGDAESALALGQALPADRTLMTSDVLARVNEAAPITDILVPDTTAPTVSASFLLGSQRVNLEISTVSTPDGPRLRQTWGMLRLRSSDRGALPRLVHGVPVTAEEIPVFPGIYPVETGRALLDWGPDAVGIVTRPESFGAHDPVLRPTLTEIGTQRFAAATESYLTGCLASESLTPPDCPFEASSADEPDAGSISWSVEEDPMEQFDPRVDYDDSSTATARLSFRVQAHWHVDGKSRNTGRFVSGRAVFDLSDDEQPTFTWRS